MPRSRPASPTRGGASVSTATAPDGAITTDIDLNGASRILDFNSYSVGANDVVNYTSASATDLVAVNRVLTGGPASVIDGTINADAGISVWLVNQEGIAFGSGSRVNLAGGSLMLSTLDFANTVDGSFRTAFAAPGAANSTALTFAGGSASPIALGGSLNVAGSIVAVGQTISTTGALATDSGSIVLVAASDVTFTGGLGNPLSFTINAGTTLGSAAVNVNDNLTGQSVVVAGGVENALTAALLNVAANATLTATAAGGTVTLATASAASPAGTITINSSDAASIDQAGALVAAQAGSDVRIVSARDLTGSGSMTAGRNAIVSTAGDAALGAITAGAGVEVASAGSATFAGAVEADSGFALATGLDAVIEGAITVANGDIALQVGGDTTVTGDINAGGTFSLETAALTQTGDIVSAGDSTLLVTGSVSATGRNQSSGGTLTIDVDGDATLGALSAAADVSVEAGGFVTVDGAVSAGVDFLVEAGTDIALNGAATAGRDTRLTAGRDTSVAGSLVAGRDVLVTGTRDYTQAGSVFAQRSVDLDAAGDAIVTGPISAGTGAITATIGNDARFGALDAGTDVIVEAGRDAAFLGQITTGGDVDLRAGRQISVSGGVTAGDDYLVEAGSVTLGTDDAASTQQAARRVFIHARDDDVTGVGALTLRSDTDRTGNADLELQSDLGEVRFGAQTLLEAGFAAGTPAQRSDVIVTSAPAITLGNVTAASLSTAGSTALNAAGAITTGAIVVDNALTIASTTGAVRTGSITIQDEGAALEIRAGTDATATGNLRTNRGDIRVSAGEDVSLQGASTAFADPATAPVGGNIGLSAGGAIVAGALTAGEDIAARAGGNVTIASAAAGDDIDVLSSTGDVSLARASALGTGTGGSAIAFPVAPGLPGSIAVLTPEDPALAGSTIRLRAALGSVSSGTELRTVDGDILVSGAAGVGIEGAFASGDILASAGGALTLANAASTSGAIGLHAGGSVTAGALDALHDVAIRAGGDIAVTSARTGDDIDFVSTGGSVALRDGTATGTGINLETVSFPGLPGQPGSILVGPGEDAQMAGSTIRLRAQTGSVTSTGTLTTAATGNLLVNAAADAALNAAEAASGSVGIRAGGTVTASRLAASADVGVIGASIAVATAVAGDDVDMRATTGDLSLTNGTALGTGGTGTSVVAAGIPGTATAIGIDLGEDAQLSNSTIRLAAQGSITSTGTLATRGDGDILVNAAQDATLNLVTADVGSMGILAGGTVAADGPLSALTASVDIGIRAGTGVRVRSANAGDDIDVTALSGDLVLRSATANGTPGTGGSMVVFGTAGAPAAVEIDRTTEIAPLAASTIRLRAEAGGIQSDDLATGSGDILVNASGDAQLGDAAAGGGSIGVLTGLDTRATLLTASRDVTVEAGAGIDVGTATAGDDIDMVALAGDLVLANGTSNGIVPVGGTSIRFTAAAGALDALDSAVGEDADLAGASIRLRAAAGSIDSDTLLGTGAGDILVNAAGNATLGEAEARQGSIGVLAGFAAQAGTLVAQADIGMLAGVDVSVGSARAGDDIDFVAERNVHLQDGTALASDGTGGTGVSLGVAGAENAVRIVDAEDPQLVQSSIRLRAATGNIAGSRSPLTGTRLQTLEGDILLNAGNAVTVADADAGGAIGILAGGTVTATRLTASRDIGVRGGTTAGPASDVAIDTATAGDDLDVVALNGDLFLTTGAALGADGTDGRSVSFTGTPGTVDAVGFGTEDAQLLGSSIRLRAAVGSIASDDALEARGRGEVLVNAAGSLSLNTVEASDGAIGLLAGQRIDAATLTASRDIGVRGGTTGGLASDVVIGSANAGDDLDVVALNGNLFLTTGVATGATGTDAASVLFGGLPGSAGAVVIGAEDAQLDDSTIRLRSENGNVTSATLLETQGRGEVLVNASGNLSLHTVTAANGSIGLLAGQRIDATTLTASRDIGVRGGTTGGLASDVVIGSASAGDDIDVVALNGNLFLTTGVATGATGTDAASVLFGGLPGSAGALRIGAEDAQLGDSTIRLRSENGNVTSATLLETQGRGEVLVNASGSLSLNTVTAANGSIGLLAGQRIEATTLTASRDIGVRGGTTGTPASDVVIGSASAGDDIDVVALNGNLALGSGLSTGAGGSDGRSLAFAAAPGSVDAVTFGAEDAQLTGSTIRLRAQAGNIVSATALETPGAGEVLVNASGSLSLNTVTAANGSIGLLAGQRIDAATLIASRDIGVRGGTTGGAASDVVIAAASAGDDIDVVALNGNLALASGTATGTGAGGTSVVFTGTPGAAGALGIGTEDAQLTAATIRLRAQTGNVTSATALHGQRAGEILVNAAGTVSLGAATASAGSVGVLAGSAVTAGSLVASRDIAVQAGSGITVATATAGDDIDMTANAGNLALTNGTANGATGEGGTSVTFTAVAGAANAVSIAGGEDPQLAQSSLRLRAQGGAVTSGGALRTLGVGDVLVNARGNLDLATSSAAGGSVVLLAGGNLSAATTIASEDVAVRAGLNATLGTTSAGDDIEIAASGLVTTGAATIGGTRSGADARHAVLDTALAGQAAGISLVAGDPRGAPGLPAGSALASAANGRNIVIAAADVDIRGDLTSADGRVVLRNTGANATVMGDSTITSGAAFAISNAELGRAKAATVVVDAGSKALELGTMTIGAATGTTDTRFLTTGAVEITGPIVVAGSAERTLQIGGLLGELGDDAGSESLATSIVARLDRSTAPRIDAGSSLLELRGERIVFGTTLMVDGYIGMTNAQIAAEVSNPASILYTDRTAQNLGVFLTARRVTVGYRNFALFQNTQISGNRGVLINSPANGQPDQTALALRLISTGETGNNSFAMFGVVNNFTNSTAALLTNEAIEIVNPTGDPNDFRVTRASSRFNGCVIGAPDRGCLSTDIPQPNFNFYDERQIALFDADDDTTIAVSPLIGRGNEGLIVNVADAPVGIDTLECRPENPECPAAKPE
ncbi:filamentous hemagglutinin N-terminal domain-containing protein [Novosphingobium soli]|uniref:filamentous hemagglutinin N-terminal domain-containing protein n=1 Tax=Novosphingobium soli TaxID=574956 RepID=UPI003641A1DD